MIHHHKTSTKSVRVFFVLSLWFLDYFALFVHHCLRWRMDPTVSTTAGPSTVAESCVSSQGFPLFSSPFRLLEITLISAKDLTPISKPMQTYAVVWIQPAKKHTTKTDQQGHKNPKWNEKFTFDLDEELMTSENASVNVEIYANSCFRDILVGTVSVLINHLITPEDEHANKATSTTTARFVALQVRRPSGNPQGILNMGVTLIIDSTPPAKNLRKPDSGANAKIQLWQSLSTGNSDANKEDFPVKPGSVYNGSMVNGGGGDNASELCSDIGPSASIVAAELARKGTANTRKLVQGEDTGSSFVEESKAAKGYRADGSKERWRTTAAYGGDESDVSSISDSRVSVSHSRRRSDGGLFSCLVYGIEFTIVCGASKNGTGRKNNSRRKKLISKEVHWD